MFEFMSRDYINSKKSRHNELAQFLGMNEYGLVISDNYVFHLPPQITPIIPSRGWFISGKSLPTEEGPVELVLIPPLSYEATFRAAELCIESNLSFTFQSAGKDQRGCIKVNNELLTSNGALIAVFRNSDSLRVERMYMNHVVNEIPPL